VVLVGDGTVNPRRLGCAESCGGFGWDTNAPHFIMTGMPFIDRFQGLIPSDHIFVMLTGEDVLPDMAIGRLPAETLTHAKNMVSKIIAYESNPYETQRVGDAPFLFVADNTDEGGFFCAENNLVSQLIPATFTTEQLCLDDYPNVTDLRTDMFAKIASGVNVLNYRGHGGVWFWASETIMDTDDTQWWDNFGRPTIILSADCLDGNFALPGNNNNSLSETFFRFDENNQGRGSAGMWSATGLGYTSEHTVLHEGFYEGLFTAYGRTMGNAINYSKIRYIQAGYHDSQVYSFTLQGDPAMILYWAPEEPAPPPPTDFMIYLPAILKPD